MVPWRPGHPLRNSGTAARWRRAAGRWPRGDHAV